MQLFSLVLFGSAAPPQVGDGTGEELVAEEGEASGHGRLYQAGRKTLKEADQSFLSTDAHCAVHESAVRPDLRTKHKRPMLRLLL